MILITQISYKYEIITHCAIYQWNINVNESVVSECRGRIKELQLISRKFQESKVSADT